MSTFVKYLDEVEVLETWTSGGQVVDLAPYLADPSALAVVLRFTGRVGDSQATVGARAVGEIYNNVTVLVPNGYCDTVVSLVGGTTVELFLEAGGTPSRVFITGEVHDHAVIYDAVITHDTAEVDFASWVARQPAPQGADVLDDISAVIVVCYQWDSGTFGISHPDNSYPPQVEHRFCGLKWFVVGLDEDGFYQTYTTGKTGFGNEYTYFLEVGYVLKTSNVVTINDRDLPLSLIDDNTWRTFDASSLVPADAVTIGMRLRNARSITRGGFIRGIGSADSLKRGIHRESIVTPMASLNGDLEFEYRTNSSSIAFNIEWYETLPSNVAPTITNTPAATAPAGVDYAEQMTASGSDPKAWELTVAPPGATIGSADGLIAWVPSAAKVGDVYDFTAVVTGPELNTGTLSWTVTVSDVQMTARLRVDPVLVMRTEVEPTQALASIIEPALGNTGTRAGQVTVSALQLTAQLRVEPALTASLETKPMQTLVSKIEPALTGTTKVEIS